MPTLTLVHTRAFTVSVDMRCVLMQTGSGKTYTMQPLPIRAAADMLMLLANARFSDVCLWVSCFEIYGGKLFDLLNSRNKLEIREDRGKRVCIVGLKEYCVEEVLPL